MTMNVTPLSDLTTNNNQFMNQEERRQAEDATQLLRDDLNANVKLRILQYQVAKSIIKNEKEQIRTGLLMRGLNDQTTFANYQENDKHFAASVNKVAVAYLLLEDLNSHNRSMNDVLRLPPADQRSVGDGTYDQGDDTAQATLGDVLYDMLNRSGNTAVRVIVNAMGGASTVNDRLNNFPEIPNTRLIVLPDPQRFYMGDTSAREALFIMEQMHQASGTHAAFMKEAMATNIYTDFGVRSQLGDIEHITLINKTGSLNDPDGNNRHDIGIIKNTKTGKQFSYAVMTTSPNSSQTATVRAEASIQEIGRNLLRYAGDKGENKRQEFQTQKLSDAKKALKIEDRVLY